MFFKKELLSFRKLIPLKSQLKSEWKEGGNHCTGSEGRKDTKVKAKLFYIQSGQEVEREESREKRREKIRQHRRLISRKKI